MNSNDNHTPLTLEEAIRHFSDAERCFQFMTQLRWPDGVTCPICKGKDHWFISKAKAWKCKQCREKFTLKTGTIMEDSPLGLDKWLEGIWLIVNAKNGISSYEIHRSAGVTQKTAWFMLHRIRHSMEKGTIEKMTGECEADECYIGGEAKNMHAWKREQKIRGRGTVGKAIVMGILNRSKDRKTKEEKRKKVGEHSTVHAEVVPNARKVTVQPIVRKMVEPGATVYTDELKSYDGLTEYVHQVINHSKEYVRGNIHTNGMENFWSLFGRCVRGTYVSVEPDHLNRYVSEEVFRFNQREDNDGGRFIKAVKQITGKRLTYKQLIGATDDNRNRASVVATAGSGSDATAL